MTSPRWAGLASTSSITTVKTSSAGNKETSMNVLDNSTRTRVIGSTGAFATGGTALGGAVATIIYELFLPNLTPNGALCVICSSILALLGSWVAPSPPAPAEDASEPEPVYELIDIGGTEFTDPAYASTK